MHHECATPGGIAALHPEFAPAAPAGAALAADDRPLEVVAAEINFAHAEAQAYASKAVERALQAGDLLLTVKARLAHGEFGDWCAANLPDLSERTVRNYMRVARELPRQNGNVADLTLRGALRLLAGPEPEPAPDPIPKELNYYLLDYCALPSPGWVAFQPYDGYSAFLCESLQHPGYFYWMADNVYEDYVDYTSRPVRGDALHEWAKKKQLNTRNAPWRYIRDKELIEWIEATITGWRQEWITGGYQPEAAPQGGAA